MRQPPSLRTSRRSHSAVSASTCQVPFSTAVKPSNIWENGTVCTVSRSFLSARRSIADTHSSPFTASLLPICWQPVMLGTIRLRRISSAWSAPPSNSWAVVQLLSSAAASKQSSCPLFRTCKPFPRASQQNRSCFCPKPRTVSSGITRR